MGVGQFSWYDLATTDPDAAAGFYAAVVGWTAMALADKPRTLFRMGDSVLAGAHAMPPELEARGVPPRWAGRGPWRAAIPKVAIPRW